MIKRAFKTSSIPFPESMKNAYGAWLAPDGTYVEVGWEEHAPVAWQIARKNGWEPKDDPDDPYKHDDPVFIYQVLFDHGYHRVTFETWSGSTGRKNVVGIDCEEPTPPDPELVIAAMRNLPHAGLEIGWKGGYAKYENLEEYKEKNLATSPSSVLDAPSSRYDPYGGAAWAATSRWVRKAWNVVSPETKNIPFTDADRGTYGAWLAPDGSYYPVDEYRHDAMADSIIKEKGWDIPFNNEEAYETLYDKGYVRIIFSLFKEPTGDISQGDMISFATGEGHVMKPGLVAEAMERMPAVRIGVSDAAGWQHYANVAEYKVQKGMGSPEQDVSPLGTSRYDPYSGSAWAATNRWLKQAWDWNLSPRRIPFGRDAKNMYGAWLAPDGTYYPVIYDAGHEDAAAEIVEQNGWDPYSNPYDVLWGKGYYRIIFDLYLDRRRIVFDGTKPIPNEMIAEAVKEWPESRIVVESPDYNIYENLYDFLEKTRDEPTVMERLRERWDPYKRTARRVRVAFVEKKGPFTKEDTESYGAWLGPDGTYWIVDFWEHGYVAEQIARKNGWSLDEGPYVAMYQHGYYRIHFEPEGATFESEGEVDKDRVARAMRALPDLKIGIDEGVLGQKGYKSKIYDNVGQLEDEIATRGQPQGDVLEKLRSRWDPYGGEAFGAVDRWLKEAWRGTTSV